MNDGIISRYGALLPIQETNLSLGEGGTPLLAARRLSEELDVRLYLKFDGQNPTGSFKDRGMVVAVTAAQQDGKTAVICASTGNTSASAAAYSARAGMACFVVVPSGNIALGKLAQAVMLGARVLTIDGKFDEALRLVRTIADEQGIALVNSVNPLRLEGQKTAAFEIVDELGTTPDILALPVGNAGNISAYAKGFQEYFAIGKAKRLPQLLGFQAEGAAPLVHGTPVDHPETVATAIRIGHPASWQKAVQAVETTGGSFTAVSDGEILAAQADLASREGVFCEPASATPVAGLRRLKREGRLRSGVTVVAVLTGHGLKDPAIALRSIEQTPLVPIPATLAAIRHALQ